MHSSLDSLAGELRARLLPREAVVSQLPDLRQAAVLILLIAHDPGVVIPLIKRPEDERRHAGQIALPGGVREQQDQDLAATALRETHEEIGVPPHRVDLLGRLDSVHISVSGFQMHPFVGVLKEQMNLQPHDREVAAIIEMPISTLFDRQVFFEEPAPNGSPYQSVFAYHLEAGRVWGATARVLATFGKVVRPHDSQNGMGGTMGTRP